MVARRAHNPEVEGSNPSPATINPSESVDSDGFPFVFVTFPGQLFLPFLFDPNRDPYGISERSGLESSREDTAHRFGGLTLGGRGHVGVGVQGEACAEVPQHPGYRFHVHPVLQGQGGKGMTQIMEPHSRQPRPFQHPVEHVQHAVRGDRPARGAGEYPLAAPRFLPLCFQNAYRILCKRQGAVGIFP